MISWKAFKSEKQDWANAALRIFSPTDDSIGFLATVSKDGRPRMAPVCPIFTTEGLYLSASRKTPKCFDLINDGRFVLHAFLGENDEEFQLSGNARLITDTEERSYAHSLITFQFDPDDDLFELMMDRALWAYWINPGQPGTRVVKQSWCFTK